MSHLPYWIMAGAYARLCLCVQWLSASPYPEVWGPTCSLKAVINIAAWEHSLEAQNKVSSLVFTGWNMDFHARIGIPCTSFSNKESRHLTSSWTLTSYDTYLVHNPESKLIQWHHLHVHCIKKEEGITTALVLESMYTWEVILIKILQCLLFKHTLTIMITKWMNERANANERTSERANER